MLAKPAPTSHPQGGTGDGDIHARDWQGVYGRGAADHASPCKRGAHGMLTQIYEVSSPAEANSIASIGISHVGVLVGDGRFPREQPLAMAKRIAAAVYPPSKLSALFLGDDVELIETWARELKAPIVHLGAAPELLPAPSVAALKQRLPGRLIMRSVPISGEASIALARSYEGIADYLLLDSHRLGDRQVGALGVTHDWSISRRIVEMSRIPVMLAGGLGPDNVADAIRQVRPAGVDSKTRTDRQGLHRKDIDSVRRFHDVAVATFRDLAGSPPCPPK
jgi:phosphoribosylanthranilate isomerase